MKEFTNPERDHSWMNCLRFTPSQRGRPWFPPRSMVLLVSHGLARQVKQEDPLAQVKNHDVLQGSWSLAQCMNWTMAGRYKKPVSTGQ